MPKGVKQTPEWITKRTASRIAKWPTTLQRFFDKVEFTDNCWIWTGQTVHNYAIFKADGTSYRAGRYIYELFFGTVDKKLYILHKCDNPPCVNPYHLFPGTQFDNMQDMIAKERNPVSIFSDPKFQEGLSEMRKKEWEDPAKREAFAERFRGNQYRVGKTFTEETLVKLSEGQKKSWENPERKTKLSERKRLNGKFVK